MTERLVDATDEGTIRDEVFEALGVLQYREIALDQGAKPLFQSESTRRLVVKEEVGSLRPDGTRR
jgi:hypothetical protein